MESSFWGVVLKPEKRYEQKVETSFHVSKACLELSSSTGKDITNVFVEVQNDEFIICNLSSAHLNESLDLNFLAGEKICFRTSGAGTVHLTGYLIPEDDDIPPMYEDESDMESEEEIPKSGNKRKGDKSASVGTPSKKVKGSKELQEAVKQAEKTKLQLSFTKKDQDDDDESTEDDTSDEGIMDHTENFAEEEDSEDDEEDIEDDDGDDDEEEEEEDEDSEEENGMDNDSDDEEDVVEDVPEKVKPTKLNGNNASMQKDKPSKTPEKSKREEKLAKTPNSAKQDKNNKSPKDIGTSPKVPKRVIKGGVQCEDLKIGSGPEVKKGKMVGMYYQGRLKSNQRVFDSTLSGKPFKFRIGSGEVIKGWDVGLEGMKVGGKRRLTIPPNMAYGSKGAPPDIPSNSTLVFEVECKFVN